ncbi:NB-ARC domain, LRR domain containing protein [Trema orientale]|uniref:NB-ARC domain, LRR domain containing protein n=1 Tax=Trema orientale TaxID=63057 RepID=A0A2P5DBN8_TREOI|nr:NB-ARC domain, LRR domain containing protein [Trema orientale]
MFGVISSTPLDTKMDKLKNRTERLESRKADINDELKLVESSSSLRPRKTVKRWLENVESISNKVQRLEQDVKESSWYSRGRLEMDVENHTTEVTELIEEGKFQNGLTIEVFELERDPFVTKELVGDTFEKNKKMILDCLLHGDDPVIGVYGMGGVGKTTMLTHIYNELLADRVNVSWVTVSENCSIHKLQRDIAKIVKLDISKEDDERKRAAKLRGALERWENFILILDDVWERISLDEVGICVGMRGHKLVLTTRSKEVCQKMNCRKPIYVHTLNHQEAWTLFMKTFGNDTPLSHEIEEIANSLVKECDGLPLGVATMAGSMKGVDDIHEWSNALKEIKEAKYRNGDMEFFEVFNVLKHSYDRLKDPLIQQCLLYCSLFPEDALIGSDELIEYFIDEKLIDNGMNSRRSDQIAKGHTMLNKLEKVCLLEGGTDKHGIKYVKMHDLIRDTAIKIASTEFLVRARMEVIINEIEWSEDHVRVSLMNNYILKLMNSSPPRCPKLLTLLLRDNRALKVIPDDFFMHMKKLSILDLSNTDIESLPTSMSNLQCLTALLLSGCEWLWDVPSLENLTALRRLDLSETGISELPKGMEKLINLRYLNLYDCRRLENIPDGILSQLSHIQYFKSDTFNLHGAEVAHWRKLDEFYGTFYHIDDLNTCVKSWDEREANINCTISVGGEYHRVQELKNQVFLSGIDGDTTCVLPKSIKCLSVLYCRLATNLSHMVELRGTLRECHMSGCRSMRHVICSCCCNVLFSKSLEILRLGGLPMLTDLIERQKIPPPSPSSSVLPINAFSSLKELNIAICDGLKRLFTLSQLLHLQSLERLKV